MLKTISKNTIKQTRSKMQDTAQKKSIGIGFLRLKKTDMRKQRKYLQRPQEFTRGEKCVGSTATHAQNNTFTKTTTSPQTKHTSTNPPQIAEACTAVLRSRTERYLVCV